MEQETKLYELGYILVQTLSEDEARQAAGALRAKIEELRAIIAEEVPPKRRALAYPIAEHQYGYFGWIKFMAPASVTTALGKELKKDHNLIRTLLITAKPYHQQKIVPRKKASQPATKEKEAEIAEIDKKLEEILG